MITKIILGIIKSTTMIMRTNDTTKIIIFQLITFSFLFSLSIWLHKLFSIYHLTRPFPAWRRAKDPAQVSEVAHCLPISWLARDTQCTLPRSSRRLVAICQRCLRLILAASTSYLLTMTRGRKTSGMLQNAVCKYWRRLHSPAEMCRSLRRRFYASTKSRLTETNTVSLSLFLTGIRVAKFHYHFF